MNLRTTLALTLAGLAATLCTAGSAAAQEAAALAPQEVVFDSLDGTRLRAWWFSPPALPHGTVVALHGCGGLYASTGPRADRLNARHQAMAEMLLGEGYAVLFPDSLTPRGERELCTQRIGQRRIDQTQRRADALAALAWAARQPSAAPGAVALLGWSHGGSAVLASTDANRADVRAQPVQPVLAVAFYPGCSAALHGRWQPAAPLLMLLGELDDWTPPQPCQALAARSGSEARVFEGSYHDFDNPQGAVRLRLDVPNGTHPGQGVHAGPNPAARVVAYALLRERLRDAFTMAARARAPSAGP